MTSWNLLPVALVLLCSSVLCSRDCNLFQGLQEDFTFLHQLSTSSLVPCLKDRNNFNFPKGVMEGSHLQRKDAMNIVYEILQQTFSLFSKDVTPTTWNKTQVSQLLIGLHQQLNQLQRCLGRTPSGSKNRQVSLTLKSYFQRVYQYLQGKKHSPCSWEIVRVEIRRIFLFTIKLQRKFIN